MNIFKMFKIRKENNKKKNDDIQSKRKPCCESCKHCYLYDISEGYDIYKCFLNDPEFKNSGFGIYDHKCKYYKPCRSYRKWLKENLKDEK